MSSRAFQGLESAMNREISAALVPVEPIAVDELLTDLEPETARLRVR